MTVRRGFALTELLVSVLLLAIVGGAIAGGLHRQQQIFRSIAAMVATRGDARDAVEVIAADLSAVSPLDTLTLAVDSAVEFFGLIGASVGCDASPEYVVRLPPERLQSGTRLTSLLAAPDSGDVLLLFNPDSAGTGGGPRWERHAIVAVSTAQAATACPAATGFTSTADQSSIAYVVTLSGAASVGIPGGTPVRVLRRARYSLYRASDSRWYLGQRRCSSVGLGACGTIQPASGPYLAYSGAGQSGIALTYTDVTGVPVLSPGGTTRVSLVQVSVRARTPTPIQLGGSSAGQFVDSASLAIALRNRD